MGIDVSFPKPRLRNGRQPQVLATEYASYHDDVIEALATELTKASNGRRRPIVLYDPMAGTAPLLPIAEHQGCIAYFNDLNSLHRYVNAAKTYRSYRVFKKVGPRELLEALRPTASRLDKCPRTATSEWIEESVLGCLARAWTECDRHRESVGIILRASLLLAVRDFASVVRTSNPAWLKPGGLRPRRPAIEIFRGAIGRIGAYHEAVHVESSEAQRGKVFLSNYDASHMAPRREVDVIMTSPPFCNRVDWDRLYAPEHYFLSAVGVWHTRTEFVGTTAVRKYPSFSDDRAYVEARSQYLRSFLREVARRQRGDERESDYYVKYFTRYFAGLFRVFGTAASALSRNSLGIYFAVQDNIHRGLSIEIHSALLEFLSTEGFRTPSLSESWDRAHLGLQNLSRVYRLVTSKQRETIWHVVR
jgi:hypothetical protein